MLKKILMLSLIGYFTLSLTTKEQLCRNIVMNETILPPKFLFKIVSKEEWMNSQFMDSVKLCDEDKHCIPLIREDQVEKHVNGFKKREIDCIILKVETSKLSGKITYGINPGEITKYYHLYEGFIPMEAVTEVKIADIEKENTGDYLKA